MVTAWMTVPGEGPSPFSPFHRGQGGGRKQELRIGSWGAAPMDTRDILRRGANGKHPGNNLGQRQSVVLQVGTFRSVFDSADAEGTYRPDARRGSPTARKRPRASLEQPRQDVN